MLVNSKITQRSVDKLMERVGKSGQDNKEYKTLVKEYKVLQGKVAQLERKLDSVQNDNNSLETKTFALGRQVVQMRQLYQQMLTEFQKQQQMLMLNADRTR